MQEENGLIINPTFKRFLEIFSALGEVSSVVQAILIASYVLYRFIFNYKGNAAIILMWVLLALLLWGISYFLRSRRQFESFSGSKLSLVAREIVYLCFLDSIFFLVLVLVSPMIESGVLGGVGGLLWGGEEVGLVRQLALQIIVLTFSIVFVLAFSVVVKEQFSAVVNQIHFVKNMQNEDLKARGEYFMFAAMMFLSVFIVFYFFGDWLFELDLFEDVTFIQGPVIFLPVLYYVTALCRGSRFLQNPSEHLSVQS